jgi:hypothetical protein
VVVVPPDHTGGHWARPTPVAEWRAWLAGERGRAAAAWRDAGIAGGHRPLTAATSKAAADRGWTLDPIHLLGAGNATLHGRAAGVHMPWRAARSGKRLGLCVHCDSSSRSRFKAPLARVPISGAASSGLPPQITSGANHTLGTRFEGRLPTLSRRLTSSSRPMMKGPSTRFQDGRDAFNLA